MVGTKFIFAWASWKREGRVSVKLVLLQRLCVISLYVRELLSGKRGRWSLGERQAVDAVHRQGQVASWVKWVGRALVLNLSKVAVEFAGTLLNDTKMNICF